MNYYKSKASSNHFAGQIINLDDNGEEISFMKHSEKYFLWPDPLNDCWININHMHLTLDTPDMDRFSISYLIMTILKKWIIVVFRSTTIVHDDGRYF